ncbi:MAG TPA: ATP-binding cassette domain-containing protein [Spirochaetia bacterium]|nr:ATP-binding cassette domain-containing protein [Spirochaetia bacterium]
MTRLFEFQAISYSLGSGAGRRVMVSGTAGEGDVLVVQGPSGAGKTTLLRILARLAPCPGGEAFLAGESWRQIPGPVWRSTVHCLAQKPVFFDGTVGANLAMPFETRLMRAGRPFDPGLARHRMDELLLPAGLWDQDARTLSGGEAARVALVRALALDPRVLLLDEPAAALDTVSREALYRVLAGWLQGGVRAALLVSHGEGYSGLDRVSFLTIEAQEGD